MKTAVLLLSLLLTLSCNHTPKAYPSSWWEDGVTKKKSWEILPSSVRAPQVILSKRNELGLLSHFAATPFRFKGKIYGSIEGFWQATKFPEDSKDPRFSMAQWPYSRQQVEQMVGFQAKRAGSFASSVMKKNKVNWVSFAGQKMIYHQAGKSPFYKLIKAAMEEKLKQNPKVMSVLMATGDLELLPDHKQKKEVPLAWHYFKIYQDLRDQKK